jgi:hypothetical protein
MSIAISSIFGTCIRTVVQPANIDRQYAGLPGANGVLSMHLGSRGRQLVVRGSLYTTGATYALARAAMFIYLSAIETWLSPDTLAVALTYFNEIYLDCVMDRFEIIPDGEGKTFHWTRSGMRVDFIAYWRSQTL